MATISKYAAYHTAITTGYTNPSNAYADDGVYATAAPGKNAEVSAYFGFPAFTTSEIPDGSIINSVTTEFEYKVSTTASIATQYWQTFNRTTALGTEQSDASEPTSDVIKTHQVTSGITLTDLRSNDVVRMRLRSARGNSNTAVTFYIDYVKITVDYTPAILGAASLTGLGSLSGAGLLTKIGNAILSGAGSLSSIATIIYNAQVILSGIGSLTAQGIKTIFGQASLVGQGLLSAIGEIINVSYIYGSAALSGVGQLVANGSKIILGQVQLLGQGTLSAIGILIKQASATLSGLGSLTASGIKTIISQANLVGQGILSTTGNAIKTGIAILSGIGYLTVTEAKEFIEIISGGGGRIKRFYAPVERKAVEIIPKPTPKRSKAAAEYIAELKEKILETGVVRNTHKPYDPRHNRRYKVSEKQALRIAYEIAKEKGMRVGKYKGPHIK